MTTYIDSSLLQTGDVLLSRSKHKVSRFIAKYTKGLYSHAAIYVHNYDVFEARRDGVGFSSLTPVRAEVAPGKAPRILCSMDDYEHISLFRCPGKLRTDRSRDSELMLTMYPLLLSLNGVEYKRLRGLAKLKTRFDWIPGPIRTKALAVAGVFAGDRQKVLTQEYFCSELVVHVLTKVGLPVLKNSAQCPDEISPNDLSNSVVSNLIEIPDFVCSADLSAVAAPSYVLASAKVRAQVTSSKTVVKRTRELAELTDAILADMRESIRKRRQPDD